MPRKVERGILGYKKDPRNQILFSFNPRDGDECPSSDSGDSDYLPSDEEMPPSRKSQRAGKRKHPPTANSMSSNSKHHKVGQESVCSSDFQSRLPPEIWLRIFHYVVQSSGALPFLCRAAKVCRMWRELCENPSLWEVLDLSYGWIKSCDQTLKWLANHRLSQCHTLCLSSWKNLTGQAVKDVSQICRQLKSVNLSYCKKLTAEGVTSLVDNCCISDIDISFTSTDAVSVACLKHLATTTGPRLRQLTLGGNMLKGFQSVLVTITNCCPNLELLDVSNALFSTDFVSINLEIFQTKCPKLHTLRLTNSKFRAATATQRVKTESPGFPHLEQLSLAVSTSGLNSSIGFDDDFLCRMLKSSSDLRLLDVRGCTKLSTASLQQIPVTDLQQIHLAQSSITKYPDLDAVFAKWRHSLTHVDLSWNMFPENMDVGLTALAEGDSPSPLQHLNVAGTSVGINPIKSILESCGKLTYINLTSCRSLPRGAKREFSGRNKIEKLCKDFENVSDSELESLSD